MKNKKLLLAVVALTMCASTSVAFAACDTTPEHTHSYNWVQTTPPTCTNQGEETGKCSCGDEKTRPVDVDSDAHSYEENWTVTAPTKDKTGTAVKACTLKAEHTVTVTLPTLTEVDKYKSVTAVEGEGPTCTEKGKMTFVYAHKLGDITFVAEVDAVGHNYVWTTTTPATCGKDGVEHGKCSVCENEVDRPITALKHQYSYKTDDLKAPTKDTAGSVKLVCATDKNHTRTVALPVLTSLAYAVTPTTEGKANYTYKDGDTEVTFEAAYYENADVTAVLDKAQEAKKLVGKAESVDDVYGGWMYEYGKDGKYVHVNDMNDNTEYFLDIDAQGNVTGLKKYWGDLQTIGAEEEAYVDGYKFVNSKFGSGIEEIQDADFIGVEGLLSNLNYLATEGLGDVNYTARKIATVEGVTEYLFSFSKFVSEKIALHTVYKLSDTSKNLTFYYYVDHLDFYNVDFKVNESGMVTEFTVTLSGAQYYYNSAAYQAFTGLHGSNLPSFISDAEFDYYASFAANSYDFNALDSENPIKGYETGKYYTLNSATVEIKGKQTALADIAEEDLPTNPYDLEEMTITDFTFKDGTGADANEIAPDSTVEADSSAVKTVYISYDADKVEYIYTNNPTVVVTDSEGKEVEVDYSRTYFAATPSYEVDGIVELNFRIRNAAGNYKATVRIGSAEKSLVFHNVLAAPVSIAPSTYVYSDLSDEYVEGAEKTVVLYAGQPFYFGVTASGDDYEVDGAFTATCDGVTLTDAPADDYPDGTKAFVSNTAGTYTVNIASVKDPTVTTSIAVTVKAVPTEAELFEGTHKTGAYEVVFGENKAVTVTDAQGTTSFTYAYNAETKAVTLTKVSGEGAFGLEVTPAYTFRLTYTNPTSGTVEKVTLVKHVPLTAEKAVSGTTWLADGVYIVFADDGETFSATLNPAKTEPDGSTVYVASYTLTNTTGNNYSMAISAKAGANNAMYVEWFDPDPEYNDDTTASLVFDGEKITGLTVYGHTMAELVDPTAEAKKFIDGKAYSGYLASSVYAEFTFSKDGTAHLNYNDSMTCEYTYTLTATTVEGLYKVAFAFVSSDSTMGEYVLDLSAANSGSYLVISGENSTLYLNFKTGRGTELYGLTNGTTPVPLPDLEPDEPSESPLDNTVWAFAYEMDGDTWDFGLSFTGSTVTATLDEGYDSYSEEWSYTLTPGEDNKYYFTFTGNGAGWCGISTSCSNDNTSYIVVENNNVTKLVINGMFNNVSAEEGEYTKISR